MAFFLYLEVGFDIGTLIGPATLNSDWVSHHISSDEAEEMIRLVKLLNRLRRLILNHIIHIFEQTLRVKSLCLWQLENNL